MFSSVKWGNKIYLKNYDRSLRVLNDAQEMATVQIFKEHETGPDTHPVYQYYTALSAEGCSGVFPVGLCYFGAVLSVPKRSESNFSKNVIFKKSRAYMLVAQLSEN